VIPDIPWMKNRFDYVVVVFDVVAHVVVEVVAPVVGLFLKLLFTLLLMLLLRCWGCCKDGWLNEV